MKRIGLVGLSLTLLLAVAAAQQGPRHADKQQHGHGRSHAQAHVQMQRTVPQRHEQESQQRQMWQGRRETRTVVVRTWHERGGYHGARIPAAYYRGHFGRAHAFRVYRMPFAMMAGVPRFQYAGYWFEVVDPVPTYWGPDWYQNDDVYVVYRGGGYYLHNARFPRRAGIAISVAF